MNEKLDVLDLQILSALQNDSRQSFNRLAKICHVSTPTIAERIRRLEDLKVITGYSIKIDQTQLGWDITAFIRLTCPRDIYPAVHRLAQKKAEILECYHVTGSDSFILKIIARNLQHLESLINEFGTLGQSTSTIVLSSANEPKDPPVPLRP